MSRRKAWLKAKWKARQDDCATGDGRLELEWFLKERKGSGVGDLHHKDTKIQSSLRLCVLVVKRSCGFEERRAKAKGSGVRGQGAATSRGLSKR